MLRPRSVGRRNRRRGLAVTIVGATILAGVGVALDGPANATSGPLPNVQNFEGANVVTPSYPGVFAFGSNSSDTPAIATVADDSVPGSSPGNHVLDVPYHISSYGGFSDDLATVQDWSAYNAFTFWVKGSDTGRSVEYEVKSGGTNGENSELFQGFFTDDSTGWKQIVEPFSSLVHRSDYQPGGAPTGPIDLTTMWGFAINLPGGGSNGDLKFDDFALSGVAQPRFTATSTTLVQPGGTAKVGVTLVTADGAPLADDTTVDYATTDGSATAGTLTFAANTPSGTTETISVPTAAATTAGPATTFTLSLTPHGATFNGPNPVVVIDAHGYKYLDPKLSISDRVTDLMSHMDLAEKVGQMTQAERAAVGDGTDITKYELGSLLSGGGSVPASNTPAGWAAMVDGYQAQALATPLQIPMIYGIDSVHGDNNLAGATLFPHNIGMGATRDPALVKQEGQVAAIETRATGIPWAFDACVCVATDDRWGRTYESFGEDPALVTDMTTIFQGLQDNGHLNSRDAVLATAKHFIGDGNTKYGTSTTSNYQIDQGIAYVSPAELTQLLKPYQAAIKDGVGTVMPSYSSLQILGKDKAPVRMSARKDLITGVLKGKLGFKGFVISDYAAIDELGPNYSDDVETSINAGLDMIMVPNNYTTFISDLTALVNSGKVSMSRIDDAVSRILTQKFRLGLFDHPFADTTNAKTIGDAAHRAIARRAAAESQVLLKNADSALPLSTNRAKIYVAGSNADNEGNQSGGWTLTWQGQSGTIPGATSILDGLRQDAPRDSFTYSAGASASTKGYREGVVVVGETPYAEGMGDIGVNGHTFELSTADRNAVDKVCHAMKCVVLVVSGRPMDITGIVPEADAVVASWLPGSEGEGVADVLTGRRPFTGRLPDSWAAAPSQQPINVGDKRYYPLYPYGWGLRTDNVRTRLSTLAGMLRSSRHLHAASLVRSIDAKGNWHGSRPASAARIFGELRTLSRLMDGSTYSFAERDLMASVARDLVQARVVAGGSAAMTRTAALTADAEHQLMSGKPSAAIADFAKAYAKA